MIFDIAAIFIAFWVGFAMKRGGLCTYAAALQIANEHKFARLFDFLGAASWAALVVVPLAWWLPQQVALSRIHDDWSTAAAGGALLGVGAWINRGCVFGTFVQLVGGNMNYLATLLGMALGVALAETTIADMTPALRHPNPVQQPGMAAAVWLVLTALLALGLLLSPAHKALVMVALGAGGGLLFATLEGWDFASVLAAGVRRSLDPALPSPTLLALFTTLAMIVGGLSAAFGNGSFRFSSWSARTATACLAGGLLMGVASYLIPGGNDGLLLKGIPGLAAHAFLGFASMLATMLLLLSLHTNDRGYSSPPTGRESPG